VEATFPAVGPEDGGELRAAVNVLLDQRLAHETDVIGDDFQLVGHS
jgi:hypothetical protein